MGSTKIDSYSEEHIVLSSLFKALGHPARLAIIEYLIKRDSCVCGDIVNKLPLAQPTVSQHLKELKTVGLIKGSVEGNAICYCINENVLDILNKRLSSFTEKLKLKVLHENEKNIKNCC